MLIYTLVKLTNLGVHMPSKLREFSLEEVGRSLHSNAIHLLRDVRTEDSAMGIGPAQASALSVVVFGGPLSLNELAEAVSSTDKGTKIIHEGRSRREKRLMKLLSQLDADEIRCLGRASRILSRILVAKHS